MGCAHSIRQFWYIVALLGLAAFGANATPMKAPDTTGAIDLEWAATQNVSGNGPLYVKLDAGLKALKQNDLNAANKAFTEAIAADPGSGLPYLGLAEIAGRKKQPKVVDAMLEKARSIDPTNTEVLRTLGRYRLVQGNAVAAEDILKKAIALEPSSVIGNLLLADTYLRGLKRPVDAEAAYRQAIRLDASNVGATMGLATALAAQGKASLALDTYAQASRLAPQDPLPVHASARLLASLTKFDAAIAALNKAIAIDRTFLPAYLDKGDLYMLKGDFGSAVSAYRAATVAVREPAFAYFKLGLALQAQQKWDQSEQSYLKAVKEDPRMFAAYNNLAAIAAQRRVRLDDALVWAGKAIEISPKLGAPYDTLGSVHLARGELDQAITAFSKAVAHSPTRPDYCYRLGMAYKQRGKLGDAKAAFKRALGMGVKFPGMEDARKQLNDLSGQK